MDRILSGSIEKKASSMIDWVRTAMKSHREEGDYYDDDGVLICGVCHKPKSSMRPILEGLTGSKELYAVPEKCDCMKSSEERARADVERKKIMDARSDLKGETYRTADIKDKQFFSVVGLEKAKLALKYVDKFTTDAPSLLLTGGTGTGKTYMASCVATAIINRGYRVYMDTATNLLANMFTNESQEFINGKLGNAHLVIIDDLGAERDTTYGKEKIFEVIDRRIRERKPMIVTTNLTVSQMENETDLNKKRLYSRLLGNCSVVRFDGKDSRIADGKKAAQLRLEELLK